MAIILSMDIAITEKNIANISIVLKSITMEITSEHWAKNRGRKDINSKIVEKGKIMSSFNCFQSPFMNQNHFKDFCYRFSYEILRDFQKMLILSIFELEQFFFFF